MSFNKDKTMGTKGGTSLIRADKILSYIGYNGHATFSELHSTLNLPKSSTLVILDIMVNCGLLVKNDKEQYVLGIKLYELGCLSFHKKNIFEITKRPMQELAIRSGLICHLGVIENWQAIYLDKVEPPESIPTYESWIGKKLKLHATALGKSLLAWMTDTEINRYSQNLELEKYTDKTITDITHFRNELLRVKNKGWSIDNEESKTGVVCIAAPVFNIYGQVSYAISISGNMNVLEPCRQEKLLKLLLCCTQTVSTSLGFRNQNTVCSL